LTLPNQFSPVKDCYSPLLRYLIPIFGPIFLNKSGPYPHRMPGVAMCRAWDGACVWHDLGTLGHYCPGTW